jgi:hypothetical protein
LTGCGGGGAPNPSPEGYWQGVSSPDFNMIAGYNVSMLILENGETWAVYEGVPPSVPQWPYGGLYGTATSSGNSLSFSGQSIHVSTRTALGLSPGSYSGTFAAKSTLAVTTSAGLTINAKYQAGYEQPASLADVAGTFKGFGAGPYSAVPDLSITVDSSGAFTVPWDLTCGGSGRLTPRASGKNVFDVTVTLGVGCNLGGLITFTGTAYYDRAARRLVLVALEPDKSRGLMYIAHN